MRRRFSTRSQNKMPPAIRAIDRAILRHRQKHARMPKRPIAAVAIKLRRIDGYGFGGCGGHGQFSDQL